MKKTLLIFGSPSSGTTLTGRLLSAHPDAAYLEEPSLGKTAWTVYEQLLNFSTICKQSIMTNLSELKTSASVRSVTPSAPYREELEQSALNKTRTCLRAFLEEYSESKPLVVEKTPHNAHYALFLRKLFPEAYFLHVIRDPRDVAASFLKRDLFTKWNIELVDRWLAPGRRVDKVEWLGLFWNNYFKKIRATADEKKSLYHEMRYEDLIRDPEKELRAICVWLDIEISPEMLRAIKTVMGGVDPARAGHFESHLSAKDLSRLREITDPYFQTVSEDSKSHTADRLAEEGTKIL